MSKVRLSHKPTAKGNGDRANHRYFDADNTDGTNKTWLLPLL